MKIYRFPSLSSHRRESFFPNINIQVPMASPTVVITPAYSIEENRIETAVIKLNITEFVLCQASYLLSREPLPAPTTHLLTSIFHRKRATPQPMG